MSQTSASLLPTRVPGRGRLLASLRALLRRVHRFSVARASSDLEQRWAGALSDDLEAAYVAALSSPGARAGLDAVDRRVAIQRKTPAVRTRRDPRERQPSFDNAPITAERPS